MRSIRTPLIEVFIHTQRETHSLIHNTVVAATQTQHTTHASTKDIPNAGGVEILSTDTPPKSPTDKAAVKKTTTQNYSPTISNLPSFTILHSTLGWGSYGR